MRYLKTDRMNCFSPPIMMATFLIEIFLAGYILFRHQLSAVSRLAVIMLVCLATFQLAEYNVCEGAWGLSALDWAKTGYVAITLLPPLGMHMAMNIVGVRKPIVLSILYAICAAFIALFMFAQNGVAADVCLGNYVIFAQAPGSGFIYGLYYYGILLASTAYCLYQADRSGSKNISRSLWALTVGYLSFILPTTTVNLVDPSTIAGIPSIMCGFAVIMAVILATKVIPEYQKGIKD